MAIPPALMKAVIKGGKTAIEKGIPMLAMILIGKMSNSNSNEEKKGKNNNSYNY